MLAVPVSRNLSESSGPSRVAAVGLAAGDSPPAIRRRRLSRRLTADDSDDPSHGHPGRATLTRDHSTVGPAGAAAGPGSESH